MKEIRDRQLLEGDSIIRDDIYGTPYKLTYVWDAKNKKCVELEEYLIRIQPIKRKIKLDKIKDKLK